MEDETVNNLRPPCPYCEDDSGECEHVILDYDASFGAFLSGYLTNNKQDIESFRGELFKLVKLGIKPVITDDFDELQSIWEYAVDTFDEDSEELDLDTDSYFRYLENTEDIYDAISFRYPDLDEEEDEIPGYSSACIVFYSKDPAAAIRKFNADILSELKP